jgi:hypothetical protein
MADCIICGAYTKFNGGLCLDCYNRKNKPEINTQIPIKEEIIGLSDKDRNYRYNMIKGRIAETLIQELFFEP